MVKRRTTIIGLGALATGSGAAFTSASLNNVATTQSAAMDVYATGKISVSRGDAKYDNSGISISNASDLGQANVQGDTQSEDLKIETYTRNSSSTQTYDYLLEIVNDSTEEKTVGFGFGTSFNSNAFLDDGSVTTTSDNLQDAHAFKVNTSASSSGITADDGVEISPTSSTADASTPANYKAIPVGESLAVNLEITLTGSIVSDINSYTSVTGNPFTGSQTDGVTLIDEVEVGLE